MLLKRKKSDENEISAELDSQSPYGIPIYSLLKDIGKQNGSQNAKTNARPAHAASQPSQKKRRKMRKPSVLLSEKYRAKNFFDLVGNDDANRQILRWLTYWRACVFGTEPTLNDYTDSLGRPLRKVLLVNGPPGTGKTTAAHVIANQAGFDVLEINASDERGAAIVKDRIHTAVNSHQVNSKRPICIVADEVEGASEHGFVRALINMVKEDGRALADYNKRKQSGSTKKAKQSKKEASLLLRPIVAVCNDVWASSLRNLRPHSEIVHFQRHIPTRLVQRLEQICDKESIPLSSRQLLQIAEGNEFDLRACLNALQFGAVNSNGFSFNGEVMPESCEKTDWSVLVKMLFFSSKPVSFQQLQGCSDMDRLILSCFTSYHENNFIDDMLKKPNLIGDFLALSDNRRAGDEIKAVVPHAFAQLFRSPGLSSKGPGALMGGNVFGKPPSFFDEHRQTKSIVESMMKKASTNVKAGSNLNVTVMDLAPFAVQISNPIARNLLRPEDKERLTVLAESLLELGVDLRTERLENGAFIHRLDPPVELSCIIDKTISSEVSMGSYVSRTQLKEALRDHKKKSSQSATLASAPTTTTIQDLTQTSSENSSSTADIKEKVSDFFRPIAFKEDSLEVSTESGRAKPITSKVWIQYTEGFSNAVKKPATWNEVFGVI